MAIVQWSKMNWALFSYYSWEFFFFCQFFFLWLLPVFYFASIPRLKELRKYTCFPMHARWVTSVVSHSLWPYGLCPPDSVHGGLQAGILKWVAVPSSSDQTRVSGLLHWQAGSPLAPPGKSLLPYRCYQCHHVEMSAEMDTHSSLNG